jgi:hypothetical protein
MERDAFEKVMDEWAKEEIDGAPRLSPTKKHIHAVRIQAGLSGLFHSPKRLRWGLAAAAVTAFVICFLILTRGRTGSADPGFINWETSSVRLREGYPYKGKGTGHKGGRAEDLRRGPKRGKKKGGEVFRQFVFQYQKPETGAIINVDMTERGLEGIQLRPEDNYRIVAQPGKDGHLFIYQLDSGKRWLRLFPDGRVSQDKNPLTINTGIIVPSAPRWFYFSRTSGSQVIYILVSERKIPVEENWYQQYLVTGNLSEKETLLNRIKNRIEANTGEKDSRIITFRFIVHGQ